MKTALSRRDIYSLGMFAVLVFVLSRWLPENMLADEHVHWPQALSFAQGKWDVSPWLSTWPTMNFMVSLPLWLTPNRELWMGRAVISTTACIAFIGYLKLLRALHGDTFQATRGIGGAGLRALQFFCAPVILLFTSVIYTDIPALAALVWAAYAVVSRRRGLLLLAAAMTVAFRQSHIVWFVALMLWHGWLSYREQTMLHATDRDTLNASNFKGLVARLRVVFTGEVLFWLLVAALLLLWLAVVKSSGGVAYGVNTQVGHFVHIAGWGNMCFSMVVVLLVFFPIMVATLVTRRIAWRLAHVVALIGILVLVAYGFQATLPANFAPEVQLFMRNRLLALLADPLGRGLMTVLCVTGLLAWIHTDFATTVAPLRWPLLAFSALYLLPFGLIEQRYYIPMFALFWAARKPQAQAIEWVQLGWCLALSAMLVYQVTYRGRFL